ncbi:MAG: hypothetical protein FWC36_01645 [Spirochaetes bacterium]|nr:hypothetical protein [Spirochaetota bacterium]
MKIIIVSDQKKVEESFCSLVKSGYELVKVCNADSKKHIKGLSDSAIVYLDIYQKSEKEYSGEIKFLLKQQIIFLGIIDSKSAAPDPAVLFHAGISDYIGKRQLSEGISQKRIKNILSVQTKVVSKSKDEKSQKVFVALNKKDFTAKLIPNGEWKQVKTGQEYVFYLLYAELDSTGEWKKNASQPVLKQLKEVFHNYIRKHIEQINGKVWMWNEFCGLILFPYTKKYHDAVITVAKLLAHTPIASCEDFPFKMEISYKFALHIGETVYKDRGNTGTIISDAVNFTFHLGQKFTKPGSFYLTEEVYERMHPRLKELFLSEGVFENKNILRLRKFV